KEASSILANLSKVGFDKINYKTGNRSLLITPEKNEKLIKSFRNIKSSRVESVADINAFDILNYKYVIVENPEKSFSVLKDRTENSKNKKPAGKKLVAIAK